MKETWTVANLEGHKKFGLIEAMDVLTFAKTQTILQCANCYSVLGENC